MEIFEIIIAHITSMKLTDYVDIIAVAFLLYKVLPMLWYSGAMRILKAIIVVLVIAWLTDIFDLYALNYVIDEALEIGIIALVILFQPELRRILDHIGNMKLGKFLGTDRTSQEMEVVIRQTVMACEQMSREKIGVLIAFSRDNPLDEYLKTGTVIDAQVTEQLLRNIFFPKAALHDGALIIRDGRAAAAGCVLPLSHSTRLSADLGTRHRAAVGLSEASDAVLVIVSEETGTISVAVDGMLKRHLPPQMLERLLRNELIPEQAEQKRRKLKLSMGTKEGKHEK